MSVKKLKLEITVDDKGSVHVKQFGDKTERELKNVGRAVDTLDRKNKASIATWKKLAVAAAGAFAVFGAGRAARGFLETASSFEDMEAKLDAITKGRGVETLERINQWALDMPVNTQEAINAFSMMTAMGLDPTIAKMQILVDVSSVMGDEVLPRVARALGQIQTLGKLSAEELNQLAEAGINARKYLKEAFGGKTVAEIQKAEIAISDVVKAIWDGLEREFKGSAKRRMETWGGMVVAMESIWTEFQRHVMASGPFEVMKDQLKDFLDYLATNEGQMDLATWADLTARSVVSAFEALSFGAELFVSALSIVEQVFNSLSVGWNKLQEMDLKSTMGMYGAKNPRQGWFGKDESRLQGKAIPPELQAGLEKTKADREKIIERGIAWGDLRKSFAETQEKIREKLEEIRNAPPRSEMFGEDFKALGGLPTIGWEGPRGSAGSKPSLSGTTGAAKNAAKDRGQIQADLTDRIKKLTLDRFEYERWALDQEIEAVKQAKGYHENLAGDLAQYKKLRIADITHAQTEAIADQIKQEADLTEALKLEAQDRADLKLLEMEAAKEEIARLREEILVASNDLAAGWNRGMDEWLDYSRSGFEQMRDLAYDTAQSMQDAFGEFFFDAFTGELKSLNDYLQVFLRGMARSVSSVFSELATQGIMGLLKGLGGGGSVPLIEPGIFGGPRAAGGPVSTGQAYLVGERGPELFMPKQAGTIIPGGQAGAGVTVNLQVTNNTGVQFEPRHEVKWINQQEILVNLVLDAALNNRHGAGILVGRTS